jgi:L-2-hydroxyglutarate oxidase LhgO
VDVDVVVVGAGVVGLACSELLSRSRRSVVVIEAHATFGQETSSRNSEVVHAGIYYPSGSLKAELCVEGADALYAWCEDRGVACVPLGKYIVATCTAEEPALERLLRQAHQNGASDVTLVSGRAVRRREPNVRATAALWSPRTGIVDSHAFMRSLLAAARLGGCMFAWKHRVVAAAPVTGGYELTALGPSGVPERIRARYLVNAAGLHADEVAALVGIDVDSAGYRQTYVKGSYFRIRRRDVVRHLVYPVPPAGLVGLGLHVTVDLSGSARVGPDVEVLNHRTPDYDVDARRRGSFYAAVSRYLPGLTVDDLVPDQAGIRPKLGTPGGPVRDFIISEESSRGLPGWVNLVGTESPGLTASLAIGRHVVALLEG